MQLLPNGLLVASLHTYIHALVDELKRPEFSIASPKSIFLPTKTTGNDTSKALLFYYGKHVTTN